MEVIVGEEEATSLPDAQLEDSGVNKTFVPVAWAAAYGRMLDSLFMRILSPRSLTLRFYFGAKSIHLHFCQIFLLTSKINKICCICAYFKHATECTSAFPIHMYIKNSIVKMN